MGSVRLAALISISSLGLLVGSTATASDVPWSTSNAFGPNEVVYTIDLICTSGGLVCNALDAYVDQQTAALTGTGTIDLNLAAGTFQFQQDGVVDLMDGQGNRATYLEVAASDLSFAEIPFIGAPQTEGGMVFALTDPIFDAGEPVVIGQPYPVSALVSYSAIADIVGPVNAYLPELLLPPSDVMLSGTLELQVDTPQTLIYTLSNMTASFTVQNPTTLLGEDVIVSVTADMTLNLEGLYGSAPNAVPALGPAGIAALAAALVGLGGILIRRV